MSRGDPVRVIVCGSRTWKNQDAILTRLEELPPATTIVHGGAAGADRMAGETADHLGYQTEVHRPDYTTHPDKYAPLERNIRMAEKGADLCIAFQRGNSKGTMHMIECARSNGIPVEIIRED